MIACGRMGLTIDYFYSLSPRQFYNIQKGWNEIKEAESRERMILTRRMMWASLMPWTKNLKEVDLWPFEFENSNIERTEAEELLIAQQVEATRKYWEEIDERRKNAKQ